MKHEAEIRLVEAHPEGAGRNERLDLVALEQRLGLLALGGIRLPRVGANGMACLAQQPGSVFGRRDREGVDDAAAGQFGEVAEQPAEPRAGVGQAQHAEAQGCPRERPADGRDVGRPSCSATSCTTLLFAVAVVASTGTPSGMRAMSSRRRR